MAYEARKNDNSKEAEDAKSNASNQKAVQTAAAVAAKSGNPYAAAIGKGVQIADKVSGGKASEALGKGLTKANKIAPGGQTVQNATNKLANSKMADKAMDAYNAKNGNAAGGAADKAAKAKEAADKASKAKETADKAAAAKSKSNTKSGGGASDNSSPSSGDGGNKSDSGSSTAKGSGVVVGGLALPFLLAVLPIIFIITVVNVIVNVSNYEDAFGISEATGGNTGGVDGTVDDPEQKDFYNRIIEVTNKFQEEGKYVDPLTIVAVYHALNAQDTDITYKDMTKSKITKIADAMFDEDVYSEDVFRINLKNKIIPSFIPSADSQEKEAIVTEIFEYIDGYLSLVDDGSDCSSGGSCNYSIKGFYISGSNFKKQINVNDLYVRLMQCGSYNGHNAGGQWGVPLEGEELIPFEKYILGVAYQEIGPSAPEQAIKAQMIAARSFILARPTQMGSSTPWRKLYQENGKWIIQVASCTADQVYCDPDKGCSAQGGDGQWKQVYSGTGHGKTIKGPLSKDAPLRRYAADVQGETLVNKNGYVVWTDYTNNETKEFINLANNGLDYKQIIMQVYNSKYPNAGITDIAKADCGICVSDDYYKWKQYEGSWANIKVGNSGQTVKQIGCLVTSLAIQIAKSGVQTNVSDFNPGTFVDYLNKKGAFTDGGSLSDYTLVSSIAPGFKYQGTEDLSGLSREQKLATISNIVNQNGVYAVVEVMGNTGQHWVAIDSVNGNRINMMDPGSIYTNMWETYNWVNTSRIVYYRVS